jgi:peptidyl-prolyl cis-trans isomerase SurA
MPQGRIAGRIFVTLVVSSAVMMAAQAPARPSYPTGDFNAPTQQLTLPPMPVQTAITPNGVVVEDVIARVNDQVITRSEYQRAEQGLLQEARQQNSTEADLDDRLHNLLRDMIDRQLLLSKGKDLGVSCDAEVIRQLDEIRKQNHLDSMEALERAAEQQGMSFEDFKQQLHDQCVTQQVVRDEVGRRINITHAQEEAYYKAHAKDFAVPEQIHLSEILIPTPENATDAQIAAAQAKANVIDAKLKSGANFSELAKADSGGPTASAGGDLGDFKRGALGSPILEDAVFPLPVGGNTAPIRTRQGFVILHVDAHQQAGVPPLAAVDNQVQQAIYVDQLQPALRAYLTKARDDAYVDIAPGFVDTGSTRKSTKPADIAYTAYSAPAVKKKVLAKQRMEQEKAQKAEAEVAAARAKVAEKQADKSGATVQNASLNGKHHKIRREKIRFGQAPRQALPSAGTAELVTTGAPIAGQAPGVAMAPNQSVTTITTGVGNETDENALAEAKTGPERKTRYAAHESDAEIAEAKAKLAKAEMKATARPIAATPTQTTTEKVQSAPLGLNGDTVKKSKKKKREKGERKERMQDVPSKPVEAPAPVAPTVNPVLAPSVTNGTGTTQTPPTNGADRTTLPPATSNAPGSTVQGTPFPATAPTPPPL